jgi:hypothetical protein
MKIGNCWCTWNFESEKPVAELHGNLVRIHSKGGFHLSNFMLGNMKRSRIRSGRKSFVDRRNELLFQLPGKFRSLLRDTPEWG